MVLECAFHVRERVKLRALEFADPPFADLVDRHRIEVVQLLAAGFARGDEARVLQNPKVLGHRLARHGEPVAELAQGLAIAGVKPVEQQASRMISQRAKDLVHAANNRQPKGCMSSAIESPAKISRYVSDFIALRGTSGRTRRDDPSTPPLRHSPQAKSSMRAALLSSHR